MRELGSNIPTEDDFAKKFYGGCDQIGNKQGPGWESAKLNAPKDCSRNIVVGYTRSFQKNTPRKAEGEKIIVV